MKSVLPINPDNVTKAANSNVFMPVIGKLYMLRLVPSRRWCRKQKLCQAECVKASFLRFNNFFRTFFWAFVIVQTIIVNEHLLSYYDIENDVECSFSTSFTMVLLGCYFFQLGRCHQQKRLKFSIHLLKRKQPRKWHRYDILWQSF